MGFEIKRREGVVLGDSGRVRALGMLEVDDCSLGTGGGMEKEEGSVKNREQGTNGQSQSHQPTYRSQRDPHP